MSVSRVRHRGEEPRDVDHGPSSGKGRGGVPGGHAEVARIAHAEASRLVMVGGRMPDGGAGKIERSMATEAQRAAWRAAWDAPEPHLTEASLATRSPTPSLSQSAAAREHASRMRGAARHIEVIAGGRYESRRSIAVTPSPEPVTPEEPMAIEPPPPVVTRSPETQALLELAAATSRTDAAWEALHAADVAKTRADEEYQLAHQELAGAIATVTDVLYIIPEPLPGRPARERVKKTPVVESASDHAESIPAGEPGRTAAETRRAAAAAGGGPGRPAYVARMLEAMVAAGGDFTAAADALRIKRSSLVGSMSVLRSRTDLTEAEAAAIARTRVRKA